MPGTPNFKDIRFLETFKAASRTYIGALDILVKNKYINGTEIEKLKSKVLSALSQPSKHDHDGGKSKDQRRLQFSKLSYPACIGTSVSACADITDQTTCSNYYEAPVCLFYFASTATNAYCSNFGGAQCSWNKGVKQCLSDTNNDSVLCSTS